MLSKRMISHYMDCERRLFDELHRGRDTVSVIMRVLEQDSEDLNPAAVDAPENFGFSSAQLVLVCGVLECGPLALAEMSLSAKTVLERDIQKSYLETGSITLKFPIMAGASALDEAEFELKFTKNQFRQFIMLLKRINRADSYFQLVLDNKSDKLGGAADCGTSPPADKGKNSSVSFSSFNYVLSGTLLRYIKPLSEKIGMCMLSELVPNTPTPNVPVLRLDNNYIAQCTIITEKGERKVDPRQLNGSYYSLEKNAGSYSFKVL